MRFDRTNTSFIGHTLPLSRPARRSFDSNANSGRVIPSAQNGGLVRNRALFALAWQARR